MNRLTNLMHGVLVCGNRVLKSVLWVSVEKLVDSLRSSRL